MNNLQKLRQLGQSIWYDNIRRGIIVKGELKKMTGETSLKMAGFPRGCSIR